MAKSVAQTPDVGHLIHLENELSVPSALANGQFLRIPQPTVVGRGKIRSKWIDVITVTGFITNRIIEFE